MNVAATVTALLGMVNVHGLVVEPPEHEAPVIVQLENAHPEAGVGVTVIGDPTGSEQPLGQFGLTEPEPEATFVVRVCVVADAMKVASRVTALLGMVKVQGLKEEPAEQDAPVTSHSSNWSPDGGFAVTVTD